MKSKYIWLVSIFTCLAVMMSFYGCSSSTTTSSTTSETISSTSQVYADELLIFAAGGTKAPIDAAAAAFKEKYGTEITINYGGGGEILSNMVLAKQGDVFIAPEQRYMNNAKNQGAIDNATVPEIVAYMIPVIGLQEGNPLDIQSLADLGNSGVKIAMGNPDTTLLGEIIPGMLEKAGVYDSVFPNIVTNAPQVNTIITALKTKQVDAGFIWHYFSVTNENDVDIVWIPAEYISGLGQIQASITTYSQEAWTAQQFINFLASEEGQAIFEQNGYIVDESEAAQYWTPEQ